MRAPRAAKAPASKVPGSKAPRSQQRASSRGAAPRRVAPRSRAVPVPAAAALSSDERKSFLLLLAPVLLITLAVGATQTLGPNEALRRQIAALPQSPDAVRHRLTCPDCSLAS